MALLERLISSFAALLPIATPEMTVTASVGSKLIELPVPEGMQEIANRSAAVRRLAESKIPIELRLLACFVPQADAVAIDARRPASWDRHVMVVTYKADEGKDKSEANFARFQSFTDESLAKKRGTREQSTVFERAPRYYSYVGLREHAANADTGEPARTIVAAPAIVLVKGTQISFFIYADYHDAADVLWARRTASTLRKAVLRVNDSGSDGGRR